MSNGQIVAKMVTGKVTMDLNGAVTELTNDAPVNPGAIVATAPEASVVLVFSNGATAQLGPDSSLSIEQFLQSPFKQAVSLASATQEPSTSRTKLKLNKGELLGKVAKLKHDQGSTFEVQTPVGAAGIRGTTFRLVFRPTGTGQAFAVFSLSTLEGNVNFQQGTPDGVPTPSTPTTPVPEGGVPVVTGQEVVVTIAVEVSASGQVTVTSPPVVTSSQPMSLETQAAIARQAEAVATAAATTTFAPTPATGTNEGNQGEGSGNGEGEGEQGEGEQGEGNGNSGGDGNGNSGNNANSGENNANAGQNNSNAGENSGNSGNANSNPGNNNPAPSPLPTTPQQRTTPGAGTPGS